MYTIMFTGMQAERKLKDVNTEQNTVLAEKKVFLKKLKLLTANDKVLTTCLK